MTCRHLFLVGNPNCVRCYERIDASDAVLVDLRAERAANGAPPVQRAGPGDTRRTTPDRPHNFPKGAA